MLSGTPCFVLGLSDALCTLNPKPKSAPSILQKKYAAFED